MSETITFSPFSESTMTMLGISAIVCIMLPIISVIIALFKIKKTAKPLLFGFLMYLIVQFALIPPIGNVFLMVTGLADSYTSGSYIASSLLSLVVAIIEETARFICIARIMKNYRKWNDAFMFGLGYGALGMLLSGGMSLFNDLITATAINSGAVYELDIVSQQSFAEICTAMQSVPPLSYLMAGIDQCCIAIMSVALALLLMEGITANNSLMLPTTMIIRVMALCVPIILSELWKWGFLSATLFLVMIAGISIWYIIKSKKPGNGEPNFKTI